jgi:hypothetical protein
MKPSIKYLKSKFPNWEWTSERKKGLKWSYFGYKIQNNPIPPHETEQVLIYSVSQLNNENKYQTTWLAWNGYCTLNYTLWHLRERLQEFRSY